MALPAIILKVLPELARQAFLLAGLSFLRRALLPESPATTGVRDIYVPPFTGGQAAGVQYFFGYSVFFLDGSGNPGAEQVRGNWNNGSDNFEQPTPGSYSAPILTGPIGSPVITENGWSIFNTNGQKVAGENYGSGFRFARIKIGRIDGLPDNSGAPPDNSIPPAIGGDGIADSSNPNIEGDGLKIVQGSPIVAIPSFAAALAAALAAAKSAADALSAIKSIADAIGSVLDLLNKLKDFLDGKDDPNSRKSIIRYDFGSISKDGFLRIYPNLNSTGIQASYLDIQILSIPIGFGKYFGNKSPNRYRYQSLGYISFVSPSFGIMEVREIEFNRVSFVVPNDAIAFFYHLGLDGEIKANVTGFYIKEEKQ
jgi:hypothetical protein